MTQDPLDVFFETGRELIPSVVEDERGEQGGDNPDPMRAIEELAIAADVDLVRSKLKECINGMASKIPGLLELAMMMQEPAMVDAASKMVATLSKVSTDLIGIDLRVLQESKKIKSAAPADPADPSAPAAEAEELTTADVIKMIRDTRRAEEAAKAAKSPPKSVVVEEVKNGNSRNTS